VRSDERSPAPEGGRQATSLLERICLACVRSLPVTGAAVSVMTTGGHRGVVFATDGGAGPLEDVQFTASEGPGVDAFESGRAVLVPDLGSGVQSSAGGWPAFRDVAHELGVRAVFAFPLHLGAASLGALTLYHLRPGALRGPDLARAVRLSDAAAFAVLDLIVGATADGTGQPDSEALGDADAEFYRSEIYQAAGMLTVQLGVSIQVAMVRLRSHAFATGRPTGELAREIVRRTLRLEGDNG
jgi:hypothetical protein